MNEINKLYEFQDFRFETKTNTLWRENELISLSPKALELLKLLLERQGEVVSKQEIFDNVWSETFVEDGVLTQNIYTLRQALGNSADGRQLIENIARKGYRLSVPINSIIKLGENSAQTQEIVLATQTTITEEFIEEDFAKFLPSKTPFYRKKSTVYFAFGLIPFLLVCFFAYRFLRPQVWAYFHSPLENVQFQKLTDSGNVSFPTLSPDGNFMAFVKDKSIFLKDVKTNKDIKLDIPNVENFTSLQFSPDGNSIFFRNTIAVRRVGNIYQVSRFGGEIKLVAEKTWTYFAVSPDGKNLAFIRNFPEHNKQILLTKNIANGEEKEILTRNYPENFYHLASLAWSPDAKKIAFIANVAVERSTKLFTVEVENSNVEEIKIPRLRQFEQVAWLNDGVTLIVSAKELNRNAHLWKVIYPSGDVQRITNGLNSFEEISVSADGKKILTLQTIENSNIYVADEANLNNQKQITSGNSGNFGQTSLDWIDQEKILYASADEQNSMANLWSVKITDGNRQPITSNTEFQSDYAKTSADGKLIYYLANRGRSINVWRIDSNGENLTQITDANDGLRLYPNVSNDGKFVYYLFRNREKSAIKRFTLNDKKEEDFLETQQLTPSAFVSISPDGKQIMTLNMRTDTISNDDESIYQLLVFSTENPKEFKLYNLKNFNYFIKFSPDGKSFEFAVWSENESKLIRQNFETGEQKELINLPKERIFNFAWSKDGKNLAISRGQQLKDSVLLTNFE